MEDILHNIFCKATDFTTPTRLIYVSDDFIRTNVRFMALLRFVLLATNDSIWCNSIQYTRFIARYVPLSDRDIKWGREDFLYLLIRMRQVMRWVPNAMRLN